jgi:hypothetical protein
VSSAAITLSVASQRVFIFVGVYFVIYSVRKFLDAPSYEAYFVIRSSVYILLLQIKRVPDLMPFSFGHSWFSWTFLMVYSSANCSKNIHYLRPHPAPPTNMLNFLSCGVSTMDFTRKVAIVRQTHSRFFHCSRDFV